MHRSQNRIESYHQLRSFISQVSGKKQLIGRTDLDVAISNQCGRIIAHVVIAYNSIMLSIQGFGLVVLASIMKYQTRVI